MKLRLKRKEINNKWIVLEYEDGSGIAIYRYNSYLNMLESEHNCHCEIKNIFGDDGFDTAKIVLPNGDKIIFTGANFSLNNLSLNIAANQFDGELTFHISDSLIVKIKGANSIPFDTNTFNY